MMPSGMEDLSHGLGRIVEPSKVRRSTFSSFFFGAGFLPSKPVLNTVANTSKQTREGVSGIRAIKDYVCNTRAVGS